MSAPGPDQGGFQVDPDVIDALATSMAQQTHRLRVSADVARPVNPSAWGPIGQLFAGSAQAATTEAKAAIGDLAAASSDTTRALRAAQGSYLDVEQIMATRFRELGLL